MDEIEIEVSAHDQECVLSEMQESRPKSFLKEVECVDSLFVIDAIPSKSEHLRRVPSYNKRISDVLSRVEKEPPPDDRNCPRPITCFNCNGNHNVRDCQQPKDYNAIKRNRTNTLKRYHVEDDQRFGHFQPGQISDSLRKALGLGPKQIPKHVYNMRLLGYPPGWLEEHKVTHSGLNLFDSKGNVSQTSENAEEGEVESAEQKNKYDVTKIISYPGYNTLPDPGTLDESFYHGVPEFNPNHSKALMVERMSGSALESYKKRKLKLCDTPAELDSEMDAEVADMDIACEESPPKTFHQSEADSLYPPGCSGSDLDDSNQQIDSPISLKDVRSNSPTLNDLEQTKTLLLAELNATCGSTNVTEEIEADCLSLSPSISLRNFAESILLPNANSSSNGNLFDEVNRDSNEVSSPANTSLSQLSQASSDASPDSRIQIDDVSGIETTEFDDTRDTILENNSAITNESGDMNRSDNENELAITDKSKNEISDANISDILNSSLSNTTNTPENSNGEQSVSLSENFSTPVRKVKASALGTPVISYSPYSNLPNSECFSKEMADVIHFENLPNSTGKYNKMRGLLVKVRNTLQDMK